MTFNMSEKELTKAQKLKLLDQILNQIKQEGSLSGVIFSYREGRVIAENLSDNNPDFDSEEYSSMCASVLESALGLGKTIGGKKFHKVIAELDQNTIILIECDDKTFLSLVLNDGSKLDSIFEKIENYLKKIMFLY